MEIGLFTSLVLSAFSKPTIAFVIPDTVPVNVGDSMGAFNAKPGTVGATAVPAKSPPNWIFPFSVVVASAMVAAATWVST